MDVLAILGRRSLSQQASKRRKVLSVEELEDRCVLSVYTPAQITHAYGFDQIMFGSVRGDGAGQTIAIVDAYDAPKIYGDLQTFDNQFNIDPAGTDVHNVLTVAYAQGTKPAYNAGWSQEATLDVQWAHAVAPGAHVMLVEAASNSLDNLFGAVDYARNYAGVSVVSMSWGSSEFSGEASYDAYMTTPSGHNGVSFIASSGDTGAVVEYPAVSPNVLGVGGTSVQISNSGVWTSETGWSGSGGGVSAYESKPSYQSSVTKSSSKRTSPDVAYDANPYTGVYVHWTDASTNNGGWYAFGGTSIGAPQWAGLVAIANQGRTYNTDVSLQGSLDGRSQLLPAIYNLPASDFHDETSGSAGRRGHVNSASSGYDLVTGRGSPLTQLVVQHLVTATSSGTVNTAAVAGSGTGGVVLSPTFVLSSADDSAGSSPDTLQLRSDAKAHAEFVLAFGMKPTLQVTEGAALAAKQPEVMVNSPTGAAVPIPAWMTFGSGVANQTNDAEDEVAFLDLPVVDGDLTLPSSHLRTQTENSTYSVAAAVEVSAPASVIHGNVNIAPTNEPSVAAAPTVEREAPARRIFTNTLSRTFWLAGAVAFFMQGAFLGRKQRTDEVETKLPSES